MKNFGLSPLIQKYSEIYTKDPTSKVFAPLAEGYRRAGLLDKAQEILKNGIKHNPTYFQGYMTLANCYYDLGEFNLAHSTLKNLIPENRDNIRLQKLYAQTCVELELIDDALESYKYLLFLNPRDKEIIKLIDKLENRENEEESNYEEVESAHFEIDEMDVEPHVVKGDLDEWIKVDLKKVKDIKVVADAPTWKMKSPSTKLGLVSNEPKEKKEEVILEPDSSHPVITHSLVDLYIGQGYLDKAKDLLAKILELNPNEESCLKKLEELRTLENEVPNGDIDLEEHGHQRLMETLDKKLGQASDVETPTVEKLQSFLAAIQHRSSMRTYSKS